MGRIDDVLNVSGHRLGTMESIGAGRQRTGGGSGGSGKPHEHQGEQWSRTWFERRASRREMPPKKVAQELRNWVGQEIGAIAKPDEIRFGDNLPKTRSGKIMRRLLRAIARVGNHAGRLDSGNPSILEQLKQST